MLVCDSFNLPTSHILILNGGVGTLTGLLVKKIKTTCKKQSNIGRFSAPFRKLLVQNVKLQKKVRSITHMSPLTNIVIHGK